MAEAAEENPASLKAVLVGATGVTGRRLLVELIKAKIFSDITVIGRRNAELPEDVTDINLEEQEKQGRVVQVQIDFENLTVESVGDHFKDRDVFFSCLGTTRRQAGSAENFRHIDFDFNYNLAKVAKEMNVRLYALMSSANTDAKSKFLYLQVKGKLENECGLLKFPQYLIYRPGLLDRGKDMRFGEKIFGLVMKKITVSKVAQGMVASAVQKLKEPRPEEPQQILYTNADILKISEQYSAST